MNKALISNIKSKIKNKIKKNKFIYRIIWFLKNRNNRKFLDKIYYPENFLQVGSFGNNNDDKVIYLIDISSEYMGFGAYFRWSLEALVEAESLNAVPIIKFGELCPYNEKNEFELGTNSFEYYFKAVSEFTVDDAYKSSNVFIFNQTDLIRVEKKLGVYNNRNIICGYSIDSNYINIMGEIVKKYIFLNEKTKKYIDKSIDKLFENRNKEKVLAVHIRGTDFALNWDQHPNMIRPEDYFPYIDNAISKYGFTCVFLATDDFKLLKLFKNRYGKLLKYFNDVNRSDGKVNVAYVKNNRMNNNYLNGLEVVRDIYVMASCEGLIAGLSQVSICTRIVNRSTEKIFEYEKIIDNGIYKI